MKNLALIQVIQSNNKKRGNGRVNCIEFHPTNPDIFWVGAPGGGLWKTIDGGNTWTTNTDNLPVLGVSDIIIDPTNTDIFLGPDHFYSLQPNIASEFCEILGAHTYLNFETF